MSAKGMTNTEMTEEKTICTLDYLMGTLATAYKGLITSLLLKDFCMVEKDSLTIFKGTILSMPEGNYQSSLIHEGVEISRSDILHGYFELQSDTGLIEKAKNLQIDIIKNGRHIGTFLLKREKKEGFFISALELSEEIKGVNFRLLTYHLQNKVGLLKKAEEIISDILSTKQDWKEFSEKINSFAKDLFWFDKEAYYVWYDVLVKWSITACERTDSGWSKAVSNVLSLIELPMDNETDRERLHFLTDIWLKRITVSSINLSASLTHSRNVFSRINSLFPDTDIRHALQILIQSLRDLMKKTPSLPDDIMEKIRHLVASGDYDLLNNYTETRKNNLLSALSDSIVSLDGKEYSRVFDVIDSIDAWLIKDRDIITIFYEIIEKNMTKDSAGTLSEAFLRLFSFFSVLPVDIYQRAWQNATRLIRKLVTLDRTDICETVLSKIEAQGDPLKTDIVLSEEVALTILETGESKLLEHYDGILEQILIPAPGITGFSRDTWAEIVNPLHLERLSKFMDILKLGSRPFQNILIRVICNISVSGVFIPDDRIFQRQVSKYLNSGTVRENFLLHYLLLRKLPVYYHEVGATGILRDDTTEIDSRGNDPVLYFLRKQVHANASNHLIRMMEEILKSWLYSDADLLQGVVPEEVLKTLNADLLSQYSAAVSPLFESLGALAADGLHFEKILDVSEDEISRRLREISTPEEIRLKAFLMCRIYRELVKKYALITKTEEKGSIAARITESVGKLKDLKEIIIAPEKTLPQEALYFKRHIAFGIPSVMGSFHEPKFDALCESLRLEEQIRTLLDAVIVDIKNKESNYTQADVREWISCIGALHELLQWHDLGNFQIDEAVFILKENNLHISQIIDVLRICQRELTWMVEFLNRTFYKPLVEVLKIYPKDELPEYLRGLDPEENSFINKAADIVIRSLMDGIAGFFEMDRVINTFIDSLNARLMRQDELLELSDKPVAAKDFFVLDRLSDGDAMKLSPYIGNKAKNLAYLHNKGLLVPYGVVSSSGWTRNYEDYVESSGFRSSLRSAVKEIEERTGTVFGGSGKPLFLSVRSGSYVSMPGILSSILYCGMNRDTLEAFINNTDNPWLAWDSCRRFIEHYGTVVYDLDMEIFETIDNNFLRQHTITKREDLNAEQMKELVSLYQMKLEELNISIPDDVYEQLKESVKAVYRSWFSEKSVQFRNAMGISDHWGTSVTLMQMIYGNDRDSGVSVFFTRKPFTLEKGIYGDTKERATGGELVYGRSVNRPLTQQQALNGQRSLEEIDPQLFLMHEELARKIEEAMRGLPQEVEATYTRKPDGGRVIYVLQTRRMEFHRGFARRFDDICQMEANIIGRGVGVYGGALSGIVTFSSSLELIQKLKRQVNLPVILLRREASTDDVSLMPEINGILTAAGGATSHAAILAQKFHLTAIVGFSEMKIETDKRGESSAKIGTVIVKEGDHISLDGSTGLIYLGLCFSATKLIF